MKKATPCLNSWDVLEKAVKESVFARGEGGTGGARRIFRARKLLRVMRQWEVHTITHSSKPTGWTTPRVSPDVKDEGWL